MGKEKLVRVRPSALDRLRSEIVAADRFITLVTWSCAAGMVLWSMLNATPYVRAHVAVGWEDTAFVLPLVVDAAFIGALRADEIASRHGVRAGAWPVLLRLFTGGSSVFLNIGGSWEKGDWTGVFQHLVAPGLLVLLAEAGPAWRRSLAAKLATAERTAEREEREQADHARRERQEDEDRRAENARQEQERRRLQRLDDEGRQRAQDLEDEDRQRKQREEDEERAHDLEERRESARAARVLEAKRLELEEKRLQAVQQLPVQQSPEAAPPLPVRDPQEVLRAQITRSATTAALTPSQRYGDPSYRVPAPAPAPQVHVPAAPQADPRKDATVSVAAEQTSPARITARVTTESQEQPAPAQQPAGPVKDWDIPGLPADCAPGQKPDLLTDNQAHARIRYGHANGWAQRRVATFAGRSPSTIHKHMKVLDGE
ncbi:hypothetical protein ACFWAD_29695 [Rhodococcus sp. NPDC059969]|uniref:hypothetical protein n=1 Tax=Rhodococcus sp. NPDC059969 TaxID=3347018 RepID=UPI0036732E70